MEKSFGSIKECLRDESGAAPVFSSRLLANDLGLVKNLYLSRSC